MHLAEYRKRPALLADWLPWAGLVAPGVVLDKDGSFQRTARFRGPDLDSATQGELIATSARLNNALRRLGSGWALFVDAERREAAGYPDSSFPEPLSWLVDEERRAGFEEDASHFESHDERQPRRAWQGVEDARRQPLARDGFFEVDDGPELQLVDGGWHGRKVRKTRADRAPPGQRIDTFIMGRRIAVVLVTKGFPDVSD